MRNSAVLAVRFWYLTGPAIMLLWLYLRFDWYGPAGLALAVVVLGGAWYLAHAASFLRFGWYPVLGRWRRLVYRRRWHPAMATAKLAVTFDGHTVLPVLRSVRCRPGRAARARRPPGRQWGRAAARTERTVSRAAPFPAGRIGRSCTAHPP